MTTLWICADQMIHQDTVLEQKTRLDRTTVALPM